MELQIKVVKSRSMLEDFKDFMNNQFAFLDAIKAGKEFNPTDAVFSRSHSKYRVRPRSGISWTENASQKWPHHVVENAAWITNYNQIATSHGHQAHLRNEPITSYEIAIFVELRAHLFKDPITSLRNDARSLEFVGVLSSCSVAIESSGNT
ncbi:unnamed protein product [Albugo candida]|uniref:Uncharacterized protein n=1 Tax=Albugo candida TaxID=65357 RepID=A0A024GLG1_9STRA|nr:unnamed protein product [Albugo candida]|eukprot:CCI47560.1 unnamed protein product [Albugo candida]